MYFCKPILTEDTFMDKVRFGVVGTNFITDWMIHGARQDSRFDLQAVCSRKEESGEAFAMKHHIPHYFTSLEEMAASPYIDAVYIATPNFLHASQSILCMSHGKHVLCEKPMASNTHEGRFMTEASEKYGVTLMEAMKPTLTPNFLNLQRNLYRAGVIRRYFSAYCQYSSRYDKFKDGGIIPNAFNPQLSNGAIMDIGVYTIYPMVVLFGMPKEIKASGLLLSTGTDGQGTVLFRYDDMEASILYSKIADSDLPTEIQGEQGNLTLDRINKISRLTFTPRTANVPGGKGRISVTEDLTISMNKDEYYYEMAEFISLVLAGKRESSINSHQNSLRTLTLLDEIRRQLGVTFPADK